MASTIAKTYGRIKGVDFSREPRNVDERRSPMMVNMWKDYSSDSECIVTREGFNILMDFSAMVDELNKPPEETVDPAPPEVPDLPEDPSIQEVPSAGEESGGSEISEDVNSYNDISKVNSDADTSKDSNTNNDISNNSNNYDISETDENYDMTEVSSVDKNILQTPSILNDISEINGTEGNTETGSGESETGGNTEPTGTDETSTDRTVYGIHVFRHSGENHALVHMGKYLILWSKFPEKIKEPKKDMILRTDMNLNRSQSFMYNDNLYINDGHLYLRYGLGKATSGDKKLIEVSNINEINKKMRSIDGSTVKTDNDLDVPFVPITSVSRLPGGSGDMYQKVNVLTPWRKNQFSADGTSVTYSLDTTNITYDNEAKNDIKVWINDTYITDKSEYKITAVNAETGTVTFAKAPQKAVSGNGNVVILFQKQVDGYKERIDKCTLNTVFDNRVFFSGNPSYRNQLFHCELNNPEYISDLAYYKDGSDNEAINSLVVGGNTLWVFKDGKEGENNLFYHIPSTSSNSIVTSTGETDTDTMKTYPVKQAKSSTSCLGGAINFLDDICFLTKDGVYALQYSNLSSDIYSLNFLCPRSTLVNPRLTNETGYDIAGVDIYKGYLCILSNGHMYLADSRNTYSSNKGYEYEWFYFDHLVAGDGKGVYLKSFDGDLYFATDKGQVCVFTSSTYKDGGENMQNYITLKADNFGYNNLLKTTSKRGGIAKFKVMSNSAVNVFVKTDKQKDYKYLTSFKNSGFKFLDFTFTGMSFLVDVNNNYQVVKTKQKKFNEIQFLFSGETLSKTANILSDGTSDVQTKTECKPFGFYSFTLEGFTGSYIKR